MRSSWPHRQPSPPAVTSSACPTRSVQAARLGRMVLLVGPDAVDEIAVEGPLPLAVQHGGAGLRLGYDTGFPVSSRYAPPAPFTGTVHQVRIDTPGSLRPHPVDEVRAALHAD